MQGKRTEHHWFPYEPGEYFKRDEIWYAVAPNENGPGSLENHEITEHEDGTITVSPSILIHPSGDRPGWHGYLERGVWREC